MKHKSGKKKTGETETHEPEMESMHTLKSKTENNNTKISSIKFLMLRNIQKHE